MLILSILIFELILVIFHTHKHMGESKRRTFARLGSRSMQTQPNHLSLCNPRLLGRGAQCPYLDIPRKNFGLVSLEEDETMSTSSLRVGIE